MIFEAILPIRTYSPNHIEHWTAKSERNNKAAFIIRNALNPHSEALRLSYDLKHMRRAHAINGTVVEPVYASVVLTRIAPRELDAHDNLRMAQKPIVDIIAGFLLPGLARGRADSDKRLNWVYAQKKGKTKEYAVQIQIYDGMIDG